MKAQRTTLGWSILLDLVYLVASPFILAGLLLRPGGLGWSKFRRGLRSKLWVTPERKGQARSFWIHAVSVGEVRTAVPLVRAIRKEYPHWDVRVSVSTYTGMDVAQKELGDLPLFYFPLDLSPCVARFFRRHRPTAVILVELELWPNFLLAAARHGVPVLVANARITERSSRRYARGGRLARRLFGLVESFGAQDDAYRERFLSLGVDPARVEILGNLKHDREPSPLASRAPQVRTLLGWAEGGTRVIVAGSTHPGEEKALCALHAKLQAEDAGVRLVLVPRHVERLKDEDPSAWGPAAPVVRWSTLREPLAAGETRSLGPSVLLVDTVGELELFYSMADVAFVGGSLVGRGGHNLFEAAMLGKPVLFGPSYENFREEGDLLLGEAAALCVGDGQELERQVRRLLSSPEERASLGGRARDVTGRLRGATRRHLDWIRRRLQLYLTQDAC